MSFPRYERYKDSGLPWLAEIPNHWEIMQSRRLFALRKDRAKEDDRQLTASQKHGVIFQDDYTALEGQKVVQVITGSEILKHVEPNDFVISMRSFQGGIEWCRYRGSISSAYVMLIPSEEINVNFFRYLFKCKPYIQALQSTSNLVRDGQALRYENFTQIHLPVLSFSEQQYIANFLDRETAKIDELIAEQQRLIELLKEKRQAVISHAVTKGLNPDVPMKDSGVEWLGEVPEHWNVKKIKYVLTREGYKAGPFGSSLITSELSDEGDILVLTPEHVANESFDLPFNQYLKESRRNEMSAFFVDLNDVIFPIVGTLGRAMIVSVPRPGILNQRLARMSADITKLLPAYLKLILTDVDFYKKLDEIESKGAILNHITKEKLINRPILTPPIKEQKQILSFLGSETTRIDELIAEAHRATELLKERRTALISAAVTGKIDVRASFEKGPK